VLYLKYRIGNSTIELFFGGTLQYSADQI